ncbi:MAG: hypothetical protein AAF847_06250 [Bacteroidota bacterium]
MLNELEIWWGDMTGTAQMFWGIAVVFSVLAFIQFVLSLFGLDFDGELDDRYELKRSTDEPQNKVFQFFSARNVIIFFAFFGWAGVSSLQNKSDLSTAFIVAIVVGIVAMFVVGYVFYWFAKISKSQTSDLNELLFKTVKVSQTVPANQEGQGKVQYQRGGKVREFSAITEHITSLSTGTSVRIVDVLDVDLLLVEAHK